MPDYGQVIAPADQPAQIVGVFVQSPRPEDQRLRGFPRVGRGEKELGAEDDHAVADCQAAFAA